MIRELVWPLNSPSSTTSFSLRPTYWNIAKKLGVSPLSIKRRLENLRKNRLLLTIRVIPDASLLGLKRCYSVFSIKDETCVAQLKANLKSFYFVEAMHLAKLSELNRYDTAIFEVIYSSDEQLKKYFELIEATSHGAKLVSYSGYKERSDTQVSIPKAVLVNILKELLKDPFIKIHNLSKKIKNSRTTTAKYLNTLVLRLNIEPVLETSKFENAIVFACVVATNTQEVAKFDQTLRKAFSENYLAFSYHVEGAIGFLGYAESEFEVQRLRKKFLKLTKGRPSLFLREFHTTLNYNLMEYYELHTQS